MSHNDITGDKIATKSSTDDYRDGWDRIFGKKKVVTPDEAAKAEKFKQELEEELELEFIKAVAREVVLEKIQHIDEDTFNRVLQLIVGPGGTRNPMDAASLYLMIQTK